MTGKDKLRKEFERETGQKAILKFKKTKTYIFNDDYTDHLENIILGMNNRVDKLSDKIEEAIDGKENYNS